MKNIKHNTPTLGIREILAASRCIKSNWVAQGSQVELFENEICEYLKIPKGNAVALSSGTVALALALYILGGKSKRIAIPAYACSSLKNAIYLVGGDIEICDIEKNTANIMIDEVNKKKPDMVIVPHMFGIPVDIHKINPEIKVIEDCAQSIGSCINNKFTGTIGEIGIFSFSATKLITSGGQGGILLSKNDKIIEMARDFRQFDYRRDKIFRFNVQMTDLQASIGRVQLKRLPKLLKAREKIFNIYKREGLNLVDNNDLDNDIKPVRYRAVIRTSYPQKIIQGLFDHGVSSIVPIEDWELLGKDEDCSNAITFSKTTVSLPIFPSLKKKEISKIIFWTKKLCF